MQKDNIISWKRRKISKMCELGCSFILNSRIMFQERAFGPGSNMPMFHVEVPGSFPTREDSDISDGLSDWVSRTDIWYWIEFPDPCYQLWP